MRYVYIVLASRDGEDTFVDSVHSSDDRAEAYLRDIGTVDVSGPDGSIDHWIMLDDPSCTLIIDDARVDAV